MSVQMCFAGFVQRLVYRNPLETFFSNPCTHEFWQSQAKKILEKLQILVVEPAASAKAKPKIKQEASSASAGEAK